MAPKPDSRIDELARRLGELERRMGELERTLASSGRAAPEDAASDGTADVTTGAAEAAEAAGPRVESLPLLGRTLLVLAGAFLLRAVTESGLLPRGLGTACGIVYAASWLLLAERAALRERRTSASFHALASAVISFPLIWEATVKFQILTPALAAAVLAGVTGLGLGVAWLRRMRRTAWVVALGAALTTLALAVATKQLVLFIGLLLLVGLATLWLGYARGWRGLGWLVAALADVSVLFTTVLVLVGEPSRVMDVAHPESVITLQLALLLVYCGSIGARTLVRRNEIEAAEIVQGGAALLLGLGGAFAVAREFPAFTGRVGLVALVLAAGCYAASFAFIGRDVGRKRNFIFYTTMALVLTLAGCALLLHGATLALALAGAALLTAWLGTVRQRATLSLHGAVYTTAAAVAAGLPALCTAAFAGSGVPDRGALTLPVVATLTVAGVACWPSVAAHGRTWGRFSSVPKLVLLTVAAAGVGAVVVVLAAPWLPSAAAGTLAVLRTGVLALAALILARLGRTRRLPEAAVLVYPVLAAGAVKLLLEDVATGQPATLFASFALYGGALILAPRWARRSR